MIWMAVCAIALVACEKDPSSSDNNSYVGLMTVNSVFEQDNVRVSIKKNSNNTVDIEMYNVRFSPQMPVTIDMVIPGVTATSSPDGNLLSGNGIIPTTNGAPYPQYTILGLTGNATESTLTLSMLCGSYPLTFSGTIIE